MCRFTVYKGQSMLLGDILIKPSNSLLRQARDAAYHPGVVDPSHHRNILVNGDGFGLGWYVDECARGACVIKFITPAWANSNLRNIGDYVQSSLIIGHVRAATSGHDHLLEQDVSAEKCHPFKYGRWTFVHNGSIPDFKKIKRSMVMLMREDCFNDITGSTDSEFIFALFLSLLPSGRDAQVTIEEFIGTINLLISTILELCDSVCAFNPCSLNMCITDGINIIATRFRNSEECPPSLYFLYGKNFKCINGEFKGDEICERSEVVISSAPLSRDGCLFDTSISEGYSTSESSLNSMSSYEIEYTDSELSIDSTCTDNSWRLISKNTMLVCKGDPEDISKVVSVESINIDAEIGKGLISNLHLQSPRRKLFDVVTESRQVHSY